MVRKITDFFSPSTCKKARIDQEDSMPLSADLLSPEETISIEQSEPESGSTNIDTDWATLGPEAVSTGSLCNQHLRVNICDKSDSVLSASHSSSMQGSFI